MTGRHTFSRQTLDALFQAVEMDDVVDPVVSLPDSILVPCSADEMKRCFDLCLQFWDERAERAQMCELLGTLLLTGDLPLDARVRYKHIRAAYKQLRFALVLYGKRHKAPLLFRTTVAVMGMLQDAFRNRRRLSVQGYALILRLMLSWPFAMAVTREIARIRLDDEEGFRSFREAEFRRLKEGLEGGRLNGHRFHMLRKIVSRQVSFHDAMRTLAPSEQLYRMSRFLSAINGLMGSMHDDLVERSATGQGHYHRDDFPLPREIADRLEALVARTPLPMR